MRRMLSIALAVLLVGAMALPLGGRALAQGPCGEAVTVAAGDTLSAIARRCQTTIAALVEANPQIEDPDLIFPGLEIRMPATGGPPADTQTYSVRPGGTLEAIAERFGTSVDRILALNPGLSASDDLEAGRMLNLPTAAVDPQVNVTPISGPPGTAIDVQVDGFPSSLSVTVGLGRAESQFTVSQEETTDGAGALSTTITLPDSATPGDPWVVVVQTTDLPRVRAMSETITVTAGEEAATHTVASGDTLSGLARRYGVTIAALLEGNPEIENPNLIRVGQVLRIPAPAEKVVTTVQVPMIRIGAGDLGCDDLLVNVERAIPPTDQPLRAALNLLLTLPGDEAGEGLYNVFEASDLEIEEARITEGRAIIALAGTLSPGGVCDLPRIEAQLREVALQFEGVDEVEVTINGEPLEEVLSERG